MLSHHDNTIVDIFKIKAVYKEISTLIRYYRIY